MSAEENRFESGRPLSKAPEGILQTTNKISLLNFAHVPRRTRQALAKICRRTGLVSQGLHLLQPLIRNEKEMTESASSSEISEYAVLLSRNGSIQEALTLLKGVDPDDAPEALLYQGFCHISNWDYSIAIDLLKKYLASSVDDYAKLIAEVNLASSYLAIGNIDAAESLLQELMESTQRGKASRLVGNGLEMLSQVHLQRNEFSKARQVLDRSATNFQQNDSYDQLLYHKWMAIVSAIENRSPEPLAHFRNLAVSREHWESVREADLFALKIQFHQKQFDSLYYGTPKSGNRRRILQQVEGQPNDIFVRGEAGSFWLDLTTGVLHGKGELKPGKKVHQVLAALNRDFYVPSNIGTLFAELYPDDYFDINSSPLRIRQLLTRTRQWLEEMHIPASIQHIQGNYRFAIDGAFGIQIPKECEVIETPILEWQLLKQLFSSARFFTAEQACEILKISRSSFHRLARWADKRGELTSQGRGKSLRYSFAITSPRTAIRSA